MINYSEREISYLLEQHLAEHAAGERRLIGASCDLRKLGCPDHVLEAILNHRRKQIGERRFMQFRNATGNRERVAEPSLESELDKIKLF